MSKPHPVSVGEKYGSLTIIETGHRIGEATASKCRCDCGTEKLVRNTNMRQGITSSCGCMRQKIIEQRQQKEAEERAARIEKESAEREARARQEAAEQERLRQEQAARAEREAAEARQKDRDLRAAVHNDALADLIATGLTEEQGKAVVAAIVKQKIRHVSISY